MYVQRVKLPQVSGKLHQFVCEAGRARQWWPMSALGQKQTSRHVRVMSVIPLKADIHQRGLHVRFVPVAEIGASGASVALGQRGGVHISIAHRRLRLDWYSNRLLVSGS